MIVVKTHSVSTGGAGCDAGGAAGGGGAGTGTPVSGAGWAGSGEFLPQHAWQQWRVTVTGSWSMAGSLVTNDSCVTQAELVTVVPGADPGVTSV